MSFYPSQGLPSNGTNADVGFGQPADQGTGGNLMGNGQMGAATYPAVAQFQSANPDIQNGFNDMIQLPGINPIAQQTQQQIASPIFGQQSPFQPPMPGMQMPQQNTGGMIPDMGSMSFGKSAGGQASVLPQTAGPAPKQVIAPPTGANLLQGTPMAGQGTPLNPTANRPGDGLKPTPTNYRPPKTSYNLRAYYGR